MIRPYKTKDKQNLINYWIDKNSDKNISEIIFIVNKISKKNYNCYLADDGEIKGFVLIQNNELTLVSNTSKDSYKLLKYLLWHTNKDLNAHFKEWHFNINLLKKFGFRFSSSKESPTFDLFRKFDSKYYFPKKDSI